MITEWLQENGDQVAGVIEDVLTDEEASDSMKLRAVKLGIKVETDEELRRREDEREGRALDQHIPDDHAEVAAQLAAKLAANPILARRLAGVLSAVTAE